jgi:hypothetical protein
VSSAGSAVRFHVDLPVSCALVVVALPGNTGLVYIGNSGGDISSSTGLPLSAGESLRLINTCNLRELWLDAAVVKRGIKSPKNRDAKVHFFAMKMSTVIL